MASDWTDWADGNDLAAMSRSTNPVQRAGYDPDEVRADPEMRRILMQQAASPYGMPAMRRPNQPNGAGISGSPIGAVAPAGGRPGSYSPQPAMPTPRQPEGASPRPATGATTTASIPAATLASNANSARAYPVLPATDKAPTPIRPMPAAPGGAASGTGSGGGTQLDELGRQALEKGLELGGLATGNAESLATADPGTEGLETKIAREETPTPYQDASGKTLPQYKPGIGTRIARGFDAVRKGGVLALADPAAAGATPYSAPNDAYWQAEGGREQQLATDKEQLKNAGDRFKAMTDARKGAGNSLKTAATAFGNVGRDAAALHPKPGGKSGEPQSMMVNGQPALVTWDGQTWRSAEPGPQLGQPVTGAVTEAPKTPKAPSDDFDRWKNDPQGFERFERATAAAKAAARGGGNGGPGAPDDALVDQIASGHVVPERLSYLLSRNPGLVEAVSKKDPSWDSSKAEAYPKVYADYTSTKAGTAGGALNAGGTALTHLYELLQMNTPASHMPHSPAWTAYQNKAATVATELAKFYGDATIPAIENIQRTLTSTLPGNREAAIRTQAQSMGDKLDNYEQSWRNAAPSAHYQAPMPGISDQARAARAALDPAYARRGQGQAPGGGQQPAAAGGGFNWDAHPVVK